MGETISDGIAEAPICGTLDRSEICCGRVFVAWRCRYRWTHCFKINNRPCRIRAIRCVLNHLWPWKLVQLGSVHRVSGSLSSEHNKFKDSQWQGLHCQLILTARVHPRLRRRTVWTRCHDCTSWDEYSKPKAFIASPEGTDRMTGQLGRFRLLWDHCIDSLWSMQWQGACKSHQATRHALRWKYERICGRNEEMNPT